MSSLRREDPSPLTPAQIRALLCAATRELSWGLREVTGEMRRWRRRAERIPSRPIREDALYALDHKRTHADGAALFSILPARRDGNLIRLLVAYELILDFLDNVSERHRTEINGTELHLALIDAVDPGCGPRDYFRHHPWTDDGGYLRALVETCQRRCGALPSYEGIRVMVVREARRMQVLALNHLSDPVERDDALRRWAKSECPDEPDLAWYELSGAASASLVVLALLALAARPDVTADEVEATQRAYWPWMSLAAVMLDSYGDQVEDEAAGEHSYVAHYPSHEQRAQCLVGCIRKCFRKALSLSDGPRHAVIVGAMVAMYLSKDSTRAPGMVDETKALLTAGGSLPRLLSPILRLWRIAYRHRSA